MYATAFLNLMDSAVLVVISLMKRKGGKSLHTGLVVLGWNGCRRQLDCQTGNFYFPFPLLFIFPIRSSVQFPLPSFKQERHWLAAGFYFVKTTIVFDFLLSAECYCFYCQMSFDGWCRGSLGNLTFSSWSGKAFLFELAFTGCFKICS